MDKNVLVNALSSFKGIDIIRYDYSDNADSISHQTDYLIYVNDKPSQLALAEILIIQEKLFSFTAKLGGYATMRNDVRYNDGYTIADNSILKGVNNKINQDKTVRPSRVIVLDYNAVSGKYNITVEKEKASEFLHHFITMYNGQRDEAAAKKSKVANLQAAEAAIAKLTPEETSALLAKIVQKGLAQ